MCMTDLIDTTEMYLRTILDLEEEDIVPLRARISERLGHSGPTPAPTGSRMERDRAGVVAGGGDRGREGLAYGARRARCGVGGPASRTDARWSCEGGQRHAQASSRRTAPRWHYWLGLGTCARGKVALGGRHE